MRLAGIDAPEKAQAFGERSKQNLSQLVFDKDVRADCYKRDRYGRDVCRVWVTPSDCRSCGLTLDVALAQLTVGLAWHSSPTSSSGDGTRPSSGYARSSSASRSTPNRKMSNQLRRWRISQAWPSSSRRSGSTRIPMRG